MSDTRLRFGGRRSLETGSETGRLEGFDAARGVAMLLVCLSHFIAVYFQAPPEGMTDWLGTLTLTASPTFIMLSGVMVGLLTSGSDERSRDLRVKLADRALFLIVVAHPLMILALSRPSTMLHETRWAGPAFITDAIAVSILVSLWAVRRLSPIRRAALGATLYITAWTLIIAWHPIGSLNVAAEAVFGSLSPRHFVYAWPLAPWAGAYLMWTAFGEVLARRYRAKDPAAVEGVLMRTSLTLGVVAVLWFTLGTMQLPAALDPLFVRRMKWPPGPLYLMFFGSLGVAMLWLSVVCARRHWAMGFLRELGVVGRCSLAVYVAQQFLFYKGLHSLHLGYTAWWPLLFAASLVPLYLLARAWDARGWNVHLSVGLQWLVRRLRDIRHHAYQGGALIARR